ncbi:glycosyltransferase BC10-like [Phoenix dactylifera]|uniref:Glycosyltransferase BC10-like n=1 Tax=Phoenix dactylifera TaxID=42345 RepID=A0A8B9ATT5_PHODC|nr:glycosyltransferase BC10-like [Phoenix dactylifera]
MLNLYPFKRVLKVAFLFLIKGPLPLSPLWDRFFKGGEGHFIVYVHSSPRYHLNVSKTSAFYGRQIPSQATEWGSMSLVDAERRLLANALLDFSNERFVLLSDGCIPLYDFVTIYRYLLRSDHSFVHSYDEDTENGRGRYSRHLAPAIKLSQWRKGAQWFELHRSLAVNIVAEDKYYNLFRKYAGSLNYPDEHYIPTYLSIFYGASIANRTLTWVDWSTRGPHPATFGRRNITEGFIQSIRNNATTCSYNFRPTSVCFLFARKFSRDALEPLLNISPTVMRF